MYSPVFKPLDLEATTAVSNIRNDAPHEAAYITKDLSVHNSSVMLHVTVSCAMAHVICHWRVTTETWVQFQVSPCEICVGKVALREVFLQVLQFYYVSYHATNTSYSHFIHL
jgi:hypothetical protein